MRAIAQDRYGDADELRLIHVPAPEVGADDVLIRVRAAGLHIGDWHVMAGQPYLMRVMGFGFRSPKARIRGMDVAGTVEAVGQNVTRFEAGDDVYGVCDGSFADFATARVETLAPKPASLTFEQAAAIPTSACTALQALRDAGKIAAGQRVLIIGASGGVGLFAVQIAKAYGAEVTGVCSTGKVELVRSVGADHVIDYTEEDVTTSGQRLRPDPRHGRQPHPVGAPTLPDPPRHARAGRRRRRRPADRRRLGSLAAGPRCLTVRPPEAEDDPRDHQGRRPHGPYRADREQRDDPGHRPHLSAQRSRRCCSAPP